MPGDVGFDVTVTVNGANDTPTANLDTAV